MHQKSRRVPPNQSPLPRYLILDVDGTLTLRGALAPPVLAALSRAADAGIEIILNTGRSAGWGAALLAYVPGVAAVIVENGGAWFDSIGVLEANDEIPVQLRRPALPEALAAERSRLHALRDRVARRLKLPLPPTADDLFRLSDHTAIRTIPSGPDGLAALSSLRAAVQDETDGAADILVSSVHIHFMLDREPRSERAVNDLPGSARSKAEGVWQLLKRRGVEDPAAALRGSSVVVGDSGNDASLFTASLFGLTVGVANITSYLPELAAAGAAPPQHITRAAEGLGVVELIDDLLAGHFSAKFSAPSPR